MSVYTSFSLFLSFVGLWLFSELTNQVRAQIELSYTWASTCLWPQPPHDKWPKSPQAMWQNVVSSIRQKTRQLITHRTPYLQWSMVVAASYYGAASLQLALGLYSILLFCLFWHKCLQASVRKMKEKLHLLARRWPKAQVQVNKAEDDDQCFGIAQSEPRSKSCQKPAERLEEGCRQEIRSRWDRSGTFLHGRVE